jgi:DEAD/DEAH box helicase domain-containing protein
MDPELRVPEAGVTLRSVIWRRRREEEDGEGRRYETWSYDYTRAAAAALSELAPSSHFYAEGRRVQVDQIDLGLSQPREWRLCRACAHAEEILVADPPAVACPRCGDLMWPDQGRKRRMLRLRQVMATTSDRESRIGDDNDDREPAFFTRQLLVDFTDDNIRESWAIDEPDFPFGFEFLTKAVFRDINFGERVAGAEAIEVAGMSAPRVGFRLCRHCGKVQRSRDEPEHTLTCPARNTEGEAAEAGVYEDCLYLYREFASEAIRILLPATAFAGSDRRRHSFVAALQLGLKVKFRGAVGHLQTTVYEEPVAGALHRKKYLFLYDTVPGGTGYLKQLMRSKEPLLEVLALALDALRACGCNREPPPVDGCYRCLYAYRNAADMPETSRETAKELLAEILRRRESLKPSAFLSKIEVNGLFDSELEARLVEALRRAGTPDRAVIVQKQVVQGKPGYFITVGDRSWTVEPQASIGPNDGVVGSSKADFLFRPTRGREGVLPIVLFTDGFHYHRDRVGEDMRQRTAIARSRRFHVWSLTWGDVENRFTPKPGRFTNFLTTGVNTGFARSLGEFVTRFSVETLRDAHVDDSFMWLIRFLAEPDPLLWSRWALLRGRPHPIKG